MNTLSKHNLHTNHKEISNTEEALNGLLKFLPKVNIVMTYNNID